MLLAATHRYLARSPNLGKLSPSIFARSAIDLEIFSIFLGATSKTMRTTDDQNDGDDMSNETNLDQFCAALESADVTAARLLLLRDPGLATAVLPDGWPVFLLQAGCPNGEIIDLMIGHGADPNARNPSGETLLHLTGDPDGIRKLLAVGADINALDHQGLTPMMGHAPHHDTGPDAIYTLLAEGADPTIEGLNGETVFTLLPEGQGYDQMRRALRGNK